ncbi:alcohol dehydrogenase catalytic domain-containing protein [Kribbella sp. NPDC049584]|uniref:alcohol dehydrogenase catalytic domain-containing protein n=1 Tax=Kribbella sp. NPDC049584 TaxID=3154833 RepID=UPI0034192471
MYAITLETPAPLNEKPLRWHEVETPEPDTGQLQIKVAGCGVCRSNLHMVEGDWVDGGVPGISPIIPGHEVTGTVTAVGPGAAGFAVGDRVGVQPLWQTCEECEFCTSGREYLCHQRVITGEHVNGGYAEYMLTNAAHTYHVPDGLDLVEAAPLFCPGITARGMTPTHGELMHSLPWDG